MFSLNEILKVTSPKLKIAYFKEPPHKGKIFEKFHPACGVSFVWYNVAAIPNTKLILHFDPLVALYV